MKPYNVRYTEEKESYSEYKKRKQEDWEERIKEIAIEINDSSLKEKDKDDSLYNLLKKIIK